MNSGIMDAHNLAFRIAAGLNKESLQEYSMERHESVAKNMAIANSLFGTSLEIARTLGLDINNLKMFEKVMQPLKSLPFSQSLFEFGIKAGSLHLESDKLVASLASKLAKKNLHIPLILVENEFQQKLHIPIREDSIHKSSSSAGNTLYLLPSENIQIHSLINGKIELGVLNLRGVNSGIWTWIKNLEDAKTSDTLGSSTHSGRANMRSPMDTGIRVLDVSDLTSHICDAKLATGSYVSMSALRTLIPDLPQDITVSQIIIRKDGYLEVFN